MGLGLGLGLARACTAASVCFSCLSCCARPVQGEAHTCRQQACLGPCLLVWGSSPVWRHTLLPALRLTLRLPLLRRRHRLAPRLLRHLPRLLRLTPRLLRLSPRLR